MKLGVWMKSRGLTAEKMAESVGCSVSTITRLIPGEGKKQTRQPSVRLARKIKAATNGAVDFLDDDEPDGPSGPAGEAKIKTAAA